ncbi:hypothetical protein B0H13DRAFT_2343997 [Mycena leptocephala]|nr:hypothetical protein B0H13DRAFT_2343997 [Mycena leptocephala]
MFKRNLKARDTGIPSSSALNGSFLGIHSRAEILRAWIGDPPVKFGAPRTPYNIGKMREFVDYMASGRQTEPVPNARVQYVLEHDQAKQFGNQLADNNRRFIITRDYDSVLAVSNRFPVKETAVEIYTISDFKKGLQGTTHMQLQFTIAGGDHVAQDPAKHTTCLFGTFGASSRNDIYLCFPSEQAAEIEEKVMQSTIYRAVRHTHRETYPDNFYEYAATFDAEMAQAANNSSKVILAEYEVAAFMRTFQEALNGAGPWARTHYFIAQIRGVKDAFHHSDGCQQTVDQLVQNIDTNRDRTVVYVDVGLEARPNILDNDDADTSNEWTCLPLKDLKTHLQVMDLDADTLEDAQTHFDPWCGTVGIGGFRLDATSIQGDVGPYHAIYGQIYVTDKFSTYRAANHQAQGTGAIQMHPIEALRMSDGRVAPKTSFRLSDIFLENERVPVHTRYELRVPYQYAHLALWGQEYDWDDIAVDNINLHNLFAVYPTLQVWRYRWLNLAAATWILQEIADVEPQEQRSSNGTLIVADFINALCARPADRSWWKPVANAVFPLADAVQEGHERERHYLWNITDGTPRVPYFEHSRMWLPHIMWPGVLGTNVRFIYTPNRVLSHEDLPKIFNSKQDTRD